MRENVRSAGPDRLLRSIAAPDRVWVVIVLSHFGAKRTYAPHVDFTQDGRRHIVACRQWRIADIITEREVPEIDTGISGPPAANDLRGSRTRMKLAVPPNALSGHLAIVGKTGSGKTYVAKGIAESLLSEERRVCVIDPTGAWWGLRASADGSGPGYPVVIFGGEHADVPISESSAERLAELLAERNIPSVIDLSDFLIGKRHRFMESFAGTLYARNRAPLHLIVDEADEFAPQNPLPEMRRVLGHMEIGRA